MSIKIHRYNSEEPDYLTKLTLAFLKDAGKAEVVEDALALAKRLFSATVEGLTPEAKILSKGLTDSLEVVDTNFKTTYPAYESIISKIKQVRVNKFNLTPETATTSIKELKSLITETASIQTKAAQDSAKLEEIYTELFLNDGIKKLNLTPEQAVELQEKLKLALKETKQYSTDLETVKSSIPRDIKDISARYNIPEEAASAGTKPTPDSAPNSTPNEPPKPPPAATPPPASAEEAAAQNAGKTAPQAEAPAGGGKKPPPNEPPPKAKPAEPEPTPSPAPGQAANEAGNAGEAAGGSGSGKKPPKSPKSEEAANSKDTTTWWDHFTKRFSTEFGNLGAKAIFGIPTVAWNGTKWVVSAAAGLALMAVPLALVAGGGAAALWFWYHKSNPKSAEQYITDIEQKLKTAYEKVSVLRLKDGPNKQFVDNYLVLIRSVQELLPGLKNPDSQNSEFIVTAATRFKDLAERTDTFLRIRPKIQADLISPNGADEAFSAVKELQDSLQKFAEALAMLAEKFESGSTTERETKTAPSGQFSETERPEPDSKDPGIDVEGTKVYLSQYPELSPEIRSAAPILIKRVLLSPVGLSFWDPENKWGGGYLPNTGSISDQVIEHLKFFMNPRSLDRDWAFGPITTPDKLRRFIRKNFNRIARKPKSGFKHTLRHYRHHDPHLSTVSNLGKNMKDRKNLLEKISNSINNSSTSLETMLKNAKDDAANEYYQGALKGLDDQYAKSYYTGLKSMYDQKLGPREADVNKLYHPLGDLGTKMLENAHPVSVNLADAMGRGGLVENTIEQQRQSLDVARSLPTGNFRGKHAELVASLKKIAKTTKSTESINLINKVADEIEAIAKANGTY